MDQWPAHGVGMIWLALWMAGVPIAYCLDSDPTGMRWDRLVGAAMWPLVVVVIAAMLMVGAIVLATNAVRKLCL